MAKTSYEVEKEFIDVLEKLTNNSLSDWLETVKDAGISNRNDIITWLKETHNFGHIYASLLAGIYLNNGKLIYGSEEELLENHVSKYEIWRPLFESVSKKMLAQFPDATMTAKKTYVSFTANHEFAAIDIKLIEIRLYIDLGDMPFENILEKAMLSGSMPRFSHMVILRNESDFNDLVIKWLEESYKY